MELAVFYACAAVSVVSALVVVMARKAVYSALALIVCLFTIALLFFQLDAFFIAAVQVIVYAGAIMVLFLFVVMLIDPESDVFTVKRVRSLAAFALPLALILGVMLVGVVSGGASGLPSGETQGDIRTVANLLFRDYLLPFEATSILILVAVLGAMVLAKRTD